MIKHFDHITIVVKNVEEAKRFFSLLGFEEDKTVVISGDKFSQYMGVKDIKAEHHTLVLAKSSPRLEVQLLKYLHPDPITEPNPTTLRKLGFNHICFAVDDVEQEVHKLKANGFKILNEVMDFHHRKLVFISGPEGITVELAQWY
jgi:catechol 2,3-dioxygenase-like lactoylglutathione lyase family enzyme